MQQSLLALHQLEVLALTSFGFIETTLTLVIQTEANWTLLARWFLYRCFLDIYSVI